MCYLRCGTGKSLMWVRLGLGSLGIVMLLVAHLPHYLGRMKLLNPVSTGDRWPMAGSYTDQWKRHLEDSASMIVHSTAHVLRSLESELCVSRPSFWYDSCPRGF